MTIQTAMQLLGEGFGWFLAQFFVVAEILPYIWVCVCVFSVFARLPLMTLCSGLKPFMIYLVKIEFRCIK